MRNRLPGTLPRLVTLAAFLLVGTNLWAAGTPKVLGTDLGYGLIYSSAGPAASLPHLFSAGLSWGYMVGESDFGMTILSIDAGYTLIPWMADGSVQHAFVYGFEFMHMFALGAGWFLIADYGLLFNLLFNSARPGYAFGHDTRLAVGVGVRLSDAVILSLLPAWNMVISPWYGAQEQRFSYISAVLRMQFIFR